MKEMSELILDLGNLDAAKIFYHNVFEKESE